MKRDILGNNVDYINEKIPFNLNFAAKAQNRSESITYQENDLDYNPTIQMNNHSEIISMGSSTCSRLSGTTTTWIGGTDSDDDTQTDD